MSHAAKQHPPTPPEPVRVLGRGLRAQRGVRLTLRVLREAVGRTQDEIAAAAGIDQGDVSRLESKDDLADCQVATLQRYLAALGGRLEIVAAFGDKRFTITGVTKPQGDARVAPASSRPGADRKKTVRVSRRRT